MEILTTVPAAAPVDSATGKSRRGAARHHPHLPLSFQHVTLRAAPRQRVLREAADALALDATVARAQMRTGVWIVGYRWTAQTLDFVIRIMHTPQELFVQRVKSQFSRFLNKTHGGSGPVFEERFDAMQIAMPEVPRYVTELHWKAHPELTSTKPQHPLVYSSYDAYLRKTQVPWLFVNWVAEVLDPQDRAIAPLSTQDLFDFIRAAVLRKLDLESAELEYDDHCRKPALARAMIAHYAMRRGLLLDEVALLLNRTPQTISASLDFHRLRRPECFALTLHELLSFAPAPRTN